MKVYKCDVCGKTCTLKEKKTLTIEGNDFNLLDICESCYVELDNWKSHKGALTADVKADVKEEKHALWYKPSALSQYRCGNCGESPHMLFGILPDYCPWCGAKMDGEEESE